MRGRITKATTFFIVIGLIISIAIIKNVLPIKVSENIQYIGEQPKAAMTAIDTITGWNDRVWSYATHYGPDYEMAWGFYDTNSTNKYNNIYCVQTGKSVTNSDTYYVHDIYNLDDASITEYFGNETNYHHFLYILENMYLVGRTGPDKEYMENVLLNKINEVTGDDCKDNYNNMLSEINGLNIVDGRDATKDTTDDNKIKYELFRNSTRQKKYVTLDRRDNYLGTVQRYMLQSYIKQKDGNLGDNPATNETKWSYYKYEGQYNKKGAVPTNAQTYADALLEMLDSGFDSNTYDINKYKNFDENGTYINKDSAEYDETNNRIGPFTVVNPNGYTISVSSLQYGTASQEYDIVDESGNAVDLSSKTTGKDFYLKLRNTLDGTNTLSANFYIDFGDVPTARIFIPENKNAQIMTSVDRIHKDKKVSWEMSVDTEKADIALKKYIYAINGSVSAVPARLNSIDLSPLNNGENDAIYNMNKTPVEVNVGDTVTYAIQLFNEGGINATAEEITDYLPNYMNFVRAYTDFETVHSSGYDGSNDIPNTGTSKNIVIKNPNQNYIEPYSETDTQDSFKNKSQIIYIDCKVQSSQKYTYTNVAEITEYRLERSIDRDSSKANWEAPKTDRQSSEWQDYSNGHSEENPTWFDNGFHNFGGQEDDDDFDKVIIKYLDLALTKRIEGKIVDGTEVMLVPENSTTDKSRIVISGYDEVKNGQSEDLRYNMNKKVAKVERGDQLVSVITVYNEGHVNGIVKEITDYLPMGLNFTDEDKKKTEELNGDNISVDYNKNTRYLTITINNIDGIELNNIDQYENDCSKFEVKIVTSVSKSASERLYNSAAITDYGYKGADGMYYLAYTPGVDKDSYAMQDGNELKLYHKLAYYGNEGASLNLTEIDKNELQYQDDDDVDVVEVDYNPNFDLSLRKYISKVEKNFYSNELVDEQDASKGYKKYSINYENRIPVIDENSLNALNSTGTADYYHDKLKIHTEKGDLVTYRIRVYNEGKGDDCYGRATEITDYLPEGLEYVSLEDGNDENWSATVSGNTIKLTYTGEKILPTDSIEALSNMNNADDEHNYYQEVGIICRVTSGDESKIITNRAAITKREAYEKEYTDETNYNLIINNEIEDRDNSKPDELTNPNLDNWYGMNVVNEGTPESYYPGEEDDDDFDTIYVDTYKVKIAKSDGTNNIPGVDLKVLKYRSISDPKQDFEQVELNELETSVKNSGEGEHISTAPALKLENDVYIIKEISTVEGYYNPFAGKYIKFSINGGDKRVTANYRYVDYGPVFFDIYEDNGDDDYTNDTLIKYDYRDHNSEYHNVNFSFRDNEVSIKIINKKTESLGKYTVNLYKHGEDYKEIAGVQFDVSGKFNGGDFVAIPGEGKKLESKIGGVRVIPDSYNSEYINIQPEKYDIPDELIINEVGIKEGAVDSDGNPVDGKYFIGLNGKEIRIKVNKNVETNGNSSYYYIETLEVSIDGNKIEGRNNAFRYEEENGTKVEISAIKYENYTDIDIRISNPTIVKDGSYKVNIVKYKKGNTTPIAGVHFLATAHINGQNETIADDTNPITTGTAAVAVKENVDMLEENISDNDTYTITEKDVGTNTDIYVGIDKPIELTVEKGIDKTDNSNWKFIVNKVTMKIGKETVVADSDGETITFANGAEATIKYNSTTKTIEIIVTNPVKEGSFDINLIKYKDVDEDGDGNNDPLAGAKFKITVNDGTEDIKTVQDQETDSQGRIPTIENIDIEAEGIQYTITVEETYTPEGYIGLGEPIVFNATSTSKGGNYIFDTSKQPAITNKYIQAEVEEGEILIEAENRSEPIIHKGVKDVENQDSGYDKNEIQTWVIESTVPSGIEDYKRYVITDEIDPEKTDVAQKRIIFINEKNPEQNVVVKIKESDTILTANTDYKVAFDEDKKILTITFIDGDTFRGANLQDNSTLEITFNTKFALNDDGTIKGINQSIPNQAKLTFNGNGKEDKYKFSEKPEVHTGGVGVFKYDDANQNGKYDKGEKALKGAHFRVTKSEAEAKKAVAIILEYEAEGKTKEELDEALKQIDFVKEKSEDGKETGKAIEVVTGEDGKAAIEGLEFGEDAIEKVKETTKDPITGADVYTYKWDEAETKYYIVETESPQDYLPLDHEEEVIVKAQNYEDVNLTKYYEIFNKLRVYDLSLRKFITQVDGKEITDREPQVTLTDEFKDEENDEVTTAKYEHTKDPVVVQQGNIVTYTIRIYNEGPKDAYASIVKDDIPDGVEFVQYTEGDGSINDEYRWKLVDDEDNEVTDASKAKYIITDYLSMEQGEIGEDGENSNLLKKFDSKTMDKLDYRDVKVQFRVIEPNTSDRILINYAQISEETDSNGKVVTDRDSTPNVWNEGEDDQDIEQIKLLYFDLALRKWVTKAIVTQDGKTVVTETGHHAEDNPEDVVKVDLKRSKINSVVVKFEYQIRVTNEGKIGGWVDELTDHIPDGLRFEQADNPIWTVVDDKTITTDVLNDVYLEPGESTEVPVVLTWINSGSNLGIKVNIAEISKDRNEYGVHDIDSTPGNYKWGEDDIDDAPVMLSIKTGNEVIVYTLIGMIFILVIAIGVVFIRRDLKSKNL